MAVCWGCGYKFLDETECPNCLRPVMYKCWDCRADIDPGIEVKCRRCGWYICPDCGKCGCDQERPPSKEENGEGWDFDD